MWGARRANGVHGLRGADVLGMEWRWWLAHTGSLGGDLTVIEWWHADAGARRSCANLVKEFSNMSSVPGRWLFMDGDKYSGVAA